MFFYSWQNSWQTKPSRSIAFSSRSYYLFSLFNRNRTIEFFHLSWVSFDIIFKYMAYFIQVIKFLGMMLFTVVLSYLHDIHISLMMTPILFMILAIWVVIFHGYQARCLWMLLIFFWNWGFALLLFVWFLWNSFWLALDFKFPFVSHTDRIRIFFSNVYIYSYSLLLLQPMHFNRLNLHV